MLNKRFQIFLSGVFLTLVLMKPTVPMISGVALLTLVLTGAVRDLSARSSKRRWSAFKRLCAMTALGCALVLGAIVTNSAPWAMKIANASQAREALIVLAVYAVALIAAPVMAWAHIIHREPNTETRAAKIAREITLKNAARMESISRVQLAS